MAKNTQIISVSMPREHAEFLDAKGLSASALIQEKINEQIRLFEQYNRESVRLHENMQALAKEIGILHQFLEEIGKFEDFRKWRGSYVVQKET